MSNLLFSINKEKVQVKVMGFACAVNILLNIILIREYGFIGSAYAIVITEGFVVVIIGGLLWLNSLRYYPDWTILRLAGVLMVMVLTVRALGNFNIALEIIGGAISYVIFLFALKVFDDEDLVYIRSIIQRGATNVPRY